MMMWFLAALVVTAPVQPAEAPEAVSAEHAPARLDSLLAAKDYSTLAQTIAGVSRQPDLRSDLDWLKARMMEGHTAFVTMLYSRLLWSASEGLPPEIQSQLRQTAAMATLYAYAAIRIDGSRCGDASAPSRRAEQLMTWNPAIWPFIHSLADEQRQTLTRVAVAVEAHTAARRDAAGDVEFLCRFGMEEMSHGLTHGTTRELPPSPGTIGRTVEVIGDGSYRPSERPEAEWRAQAARLRASLAADLAALAAATEDASGAEQAPQD